MFASFFQQDAPSTEPPTETPATQDDKSNNNNNNNEDDDDASLDPLEALTDNMAPSSEPPDAQPSAEPTTQDENNNNNNDDDDDASLDPMEELTEQMDTPKELPKPVLPTPVSKALPMTRRSKKAFDGNMSMTSFRSSMTSLTQRSSAAPRRPLHRPPGMRERMQQRVKMAQSERNLFADLDDERSVASHLSSRSSLRRHLPSSSPFTTMRSRPMHNTNNDDDDDARSRSSRATGRLANAVSRPKAAVLDGDSALLLQLTQKVRMLEEEKQKIIQSHEETVQDYEAQLFELSKEEEEASQDGDSVGEGSSLPMSEANQESTSVAAAVQAATQDLQLQLETSLAKIASLEEERRTTSVRKISVEGQEEAGPPSPSATDVATVVRNLKDELKAAKEVIQQQRAQLELLREEHSEQPQEQPPKQQEHIAKVDSTDSEREERFKELQARYVQMELNRAWGEFQLRDRITSDALKFHRRLRHWKDQNQDLQTQLEEVMRKHAEETKGLRMQLALYHQQATIASTNGAKDPNKQLLEANELALTQERLHKAMAELAKYKGEVYDDSDLTLIQQGQLLETALERKETDKTTWAQRWYGRAIEASGRFEKSSLGEATTG